MSRYVRMNWSRRIVQLAVGISCGLRALERRHRCCRMKARRSAEGAPTALAQRSDQTCNPRAGQSDAHLGESITSSAQTGANTGCEKRCRRRVGALVRSRREMIFATVVLYA